MNHNIDKIMTKGILTLILLSIASIAFAIDTPEPKKYHLDIKERNLNKSSRAYTLRDSTIYFKFEEYHMAGKLNLNLKDTKGNTILKKELQKKKGVNYYSENLLLHPYNWVKGNYFVLELIDTDSEGYELLFQMGHIPELPKPDGEIVVNPVQIDCNSEMSLVEYIGSVKGGRAPYKVTWKVSKDAAGEDLLYAPKKITIENEGQVKGISVTKGLGYFVIMEITDSCGKKSKQIAKIECEEQKNESLLHLEFFERTPKFTN